MAFTQSRLEQAETKEGQVSDSLIDAVGGLIGRARLSAESQGTKRANKALLAEMSAALVSLVRMNTDLQQQLADKPRIIAP